MQSQSSYDASPLRYSRHNKQACRSHVGLMKAFLFHLVWWVSFLHVPVISKLPQLLCTFCAMGLVWGQSSCFSTIAFFRVMVTFMEPNDVPISVSLFQMPLFRGNEKSHCHSCLSSNTRAEGAFVSFFLHRMEGTGRSGAPVDRNLGIMAKWFHVHRGYQVRPGCQYLSARRGLILNLG